MSMRRVTHPSSIVICRDGTWSLATLSAHTKVFIMHHAVIAAVLLSAASATAESWRFHCDGTDSFLLAEINEAFESGVGYGETWDETVCNQGNLVLGDGVRLRKLSHPPLEPVIPEPEVMVGDGVLAATGPMPAQAEPILTPFQKKMRDQYFAIFIPVFGFVGFVVCAIIALVIFLVMRRKQIVVEVACPTCRISMPFVVGDSTNIFCPACGSACRVDVEKRGDTTLAVAVPL